MGAAQKRHNRPVHKPPFLERDGIDTREQRTIMSESHRRPLDPQTRARMKEWLDNWAYAGPILERERWDRLRGMTEEEANGSVRRLMELWQPDWSGDDGEELLLHQRVFARARQRDDA